MRVEIASARDPNLEDLVVPSEFYLMIFLLASLLIFVFFYATRARDHGRVRTSKVKHPRSEETSSEDAPAHSAD